MPTKEELGELRAVWKSIGEAGGFETKVEIDAGDGTVALLDDSGLGYMCPTVTGSYDFIRGYLHGRLDGEGL